MVSKSRPYTRRINRESIKAVNHDVSFCFFFLFVFFKHSLPAIGASVKLAAAIYFLAGWHVYSWSDNDQRPLVENLQPVKSKKVGWYAVLHRAVVA